MNTLYIHGLGSHPVQEKLDILRDYGFIPHALHLDYEKEPDAYNRLLEYAKKHNVQFIAGSSLGGMLAYWLGEALGVPVLLFNPALNHPGIPFREPVQQTGNCPLRLVVLGDHDKTVNPVNTFQFLNEQKSGDADKILRCSWLAHQIPFDAFEEMVAWATENLRNQGYMAW